MDPIIQNLFVKGVHSLHSLFHGPRLKEDIKLLRSVHSTILTMDVVRSNGILEQIISIFASHESVLEASLIFCSISHPSVRCYHDMIPLYAKHGNGFRAFELYSRMMKEGLNPNEFTFPCILKICGDIVALEEGQLLHNQLIYHGFESNIVVGNTLICMYAKCGRLEMAQKVFETLPNQSLVSWSSIITACTQHGYGHLALQIFNEMQDAKVKPDIVIFSCTLKACCILRVLEHGMLIHSQMLESGILVDVAVGNTLIDMYGKCGNLDDARNVFEKLSHPNLHSWGAMISVCIHNHHNRLALEILERMQNNDVHPDKVVYTYALQAYGALGAIEHGKSIHNQIIQSNLDSDISIRNSIINMYSKCGMLNEAYKVFSEHLNGNSIPWAVMMEAYSENGCGLPVLQLFQKMQKQQINKDKNTFSYALKACAQTEAHKEGRLIHDQILKFSWDQDLVIGNSLIDMYCKCKSQKEARNVLDLLPNRDVVSWGAMMSGYVQNGDGLLVISLAQEMQKDCIKPDAHVFSCLLKACAQSSSFTEGKVLHHQLRQGGIKVDDFIGNTLLNMYATCGDIEGTYKAFASLEDKSLPLWGVMIATCVSQENSLLAIQLYEEMQRKGIHRNEFIMSSILKACTALGAVYRGKIIHDQIIKDKLESNIFVENALIDMYIKCWNRDEAVRILKASKNQSIVSWAALIAGYAEYGDSTLVVECLQCMELQGLLPNESIYASILSAFGHDGQVDEICLYNNTMTGNYGIEPKVKHFNCIADVYARAGNLEAAEQLLGSIPCPPDMYSRTSFISASRLYGAK